MAPHQQQVSFDRINSSTQAVGSKLWFAVVAERTSGVDKSLGRGCFYPHPRGKFLKCASGRRQHKRFGQVKDNHHCEESGGFQVDNDEVRVIGFEHTWSKLGATSLCVLIRMCNGFWVYKEVASVNASCKKLQYESKG